MKKINPYMLILKSRNFYLLFFALFITSISNAQPFFTETFDGTACAATSNCDPSLVGWTVTSVSAEGASANKWFVSCQENGNAATVCGSACGSDQSLHLGSIAAAFICPSGDCGASYNATGAANVTDKRAESPVINCSGRTNITLAFNYIGVGQSCTTDFTDLQYSSNGGTSWNNLQTCLVAPTCPSGQGRWTAFSITLPAACDNNPNVKIGFRWKNNGDGAGSDPSFAVDDITLSVTSSNTITTGTITGSPFCACTNINVPFTSTGTFTAGNIYTAQLSNAAGSFATPVNIGTLASTANTGTIAATIPCGTATGTGYRIRVISSAPPTTGTDNGVNITINATPVATFSYTATPYCSNGADPSPTFSGGGTAGTFTSTAGLVFVSAATGQVDLSASTAGTYTVTNTIAAAGGCASTNATSTITITTLPVATFSYTGTPYCSDEADPSPTFSGGGTAGTFTSTAGLVINASTGVVDLSASTPGTYTVTNTHAAAGGCPLVTATSSITITAPLVATFSYTASPYCSTATDPSPTFSGGGSAGTFTSTAGLVINASTGVVDLSASTPGTYTVTNTHAATGGCPAVTATATITITASPVANFMWSANPYCKDAADPSPTFVGGGSAGTFSATPAGLSINSATGQVDLSASTAGTYSVTNTFAASGGCGVVNFSTNIDILAVQDSTFSYGGSTFCQSGTDPVPTVASPAGTFTATPAGLVFISTTTGEIDLSASTLGTYSVTYTTSGPCATSMTQSITITTLPSSTFSYTGTPYCQDEADPSPTFAVGASAGTFSSTAGLVFVSTSTGQVDLSASTAGTYTVTNTIAASGGCPASTSTSTIVIDPAQDSTFSYSSATYCQSGSNPTPTITGVAGGTFTSTPAGLNFVSATTGEINLATSTAGTYTVTYTTPGPCAGSMSTPITITVPEVATFSYTGSPYCANEADPSPTFSGGGVAGTFSSTAGLVFISTSSGQVDLSASTAGTYTVTNTIAAANGCPAVTATSPITIDPVQDSTFSYSSTEFCQTGTTTPIVNTPGGTFTATPAGLSFVSTSTGEIDLAASTVGTYSITYTTAGPCASSMTVSLSITEPPTADFSYTANPYCQNDPNPMPVYSGTGEAGTFSALPAGLVFVSTATGEVNLGGSTPGTYTVTNTVAATSSCPAATATATITINAIPLVSVNSPSICNGETANLTAGGADSYTWSAGATSTGTNTATASPTASTTYTVTGTTNGCSSTAMSIVTVTDCNEPEAQFTGTPTVMCEAGCVAFTDQSTNSPTSWQWSFPGATPSTSTDQNPTNICYSGDGSYAVTLIVSNASGSDTLTKPGFITIGSPVEVNISGNLLITSCEETVLTAVPGDGTYTWSPSGTLSGSSGASVTAAPEETTTYQVIYESPEGCKDTTEATVVVEDINTYFLPTGFTPNNDGINDEVHLHGRGIESFTLKIFDRIGEKVFESSDLEKGWNGRYLGLPMNNGVFVYVLDITFCNGEKVKKHGDITLVK